MMQQCNRNAPLWLLPGKEAEHCLYFLLLACGAAEGDYVLIVIQDAAA
jgi:hypothetical protein